MGGQERLSPLAQPRARKVFPPLSGLHDMLPLFLGLCNKDFFFCLHCLGPCLVLVLQGKQLRKEGNCTGIVQQLSGLAMFRPGALTLVSIALCLPVHTYVCSSVPDKALLLQATWV